MSPHGMAGLSSLGAVAVISPADVWAVGGEFAGPTVVEHWDGRSWTHVRSPNPAGTGALRSNPKVRGDSSLRAVAASSANDVWAVGQDTTPTGHTRSLIEHWNGSTWTIVPTPSAGQSSSLDGVAATSRTDAWAVGWYGAGTQRELIMHWNGSRWAVVNLPAAGVFDALQGVAATSPSDAWAVGDYSPQQGVPSTPLAYHWNGSVWKQVQVPTGGAYGVLHAVSASADHAWAVGEYTNTKQWLPLVLRWNGSSWLRVASPMPGTGKPAQSTTLNGVVTTSPDNAWAVGGYSFNGAGDPVLLHWDGSRWNTVALHGPTSRPHSGLQAIAADTSSDAWAVGGTLALHCC